MIPPTECLFDSIIVRTSVWCQQKKLELMFVFVGKTCYNITNRSEIEVRNDEKINEATTRYFRVY
jgi:hypothetical protein